MAVKILPKTKLDEVLDLAQMIGFRLGFSAFAIKAIFRANRR